MKGLGFVLVAVGVAALLFGVLLFAYQLLLLGMAIEAVAAICLGRAYRPPAERG